MNFVTMGAASSRGTGEAMLGARERDAATDPAEDWLPVRYGSARVVSSYRCPWALPGRDVLSGLIGHRPHRIFE
jgi:hypothetical protein